VGVVLLTLRIGYATLMTLLLLAGSTEPGSL
jgi:hypothetical protein